MRLLGLLGSRLRLEQEGTERVQSSVSSVCELLRRCRDLRQGKLLRERILQSSFAGDVFVGNLLLQMFSRCGSVDDAYEVFVSIPSPSCVSWTTLITAYARNGHPEEAVRTFRRMALSGCKPDEVTLVALFDACDDARAGHDIHTEVASELELVSHTKVKNALVSMYSRCNDLHRAEEVFDTIQYKDTISWNSMITAYARFGHMNRAETLFNEMPSKNVVSWTTMVTGYSQNGDAPRAMSFFRGMSLVGEKPNQVTFLSILNACLDESLADHVGIIHALVLEAGLMSDVMVGSALVNVYARHGQLEAATSTFDTMTLKNTVTWSSMIAAYSKNRLTKEARRTFREMELQGIKASDVTLLNTIDACESARDLGMIQERIQGTACSDEQTKLGNALVTAYGKCSFLAEARQVFDWIPRKDVVSWSAVISAYTQNGSGREALLLFRLMDLDGTRAEEVTFTILFDACASIPCLREAKLVHAEYMQTLHEQTLRDRSKEGDLYLSNALINMYGKCGSVADAKAVFDRMRHKDVISWTAMVSSCSENGADRQALDIMQEMKLTGFRPNQVTFHSALAACSHAGLLEPGFLLFKSMTQDFDVEAGLEHYVCLIDLLARCGRLEAAEDLINGMPYEPDDVSWASLLGGRRLCALQTTPFYPKETRLHVYTRFSKSTTVD